MRFFHERNRSSGAYSLIEMLVYISVLAVIMGVGYAALYRCVDNSVALRRNTEDITAAVHAGELWRADVRAAGRQVQLSTNADGQLLELIGSDRTVSYRFAGNAVSRKAGNSGWTVVLPNVNTTAFLGESRSGLRVWRWELELQTRRKTLSRIVPLFTFTAVAPGSPPP